MKKALKIILIILVFAALGGVLYYFYIKNTQSAELFETKTAFITNIEKKSVATGKVIPEDETNIKPQINGIIEKIYLEEGERVKTGDLIAKIKVIANEQTLNSAKGRVERAKMDLANVTLDYDRNKGLYDKGVIAVQAFNEIELKYKQAKLELKNAENDFQIIKIGTSDPSTSTNTNVRATVSGTILEIPVKKGHQVISANNFNEGTTIATIADLSKMIFEGQVDEAEVGKLKEGTILDVNVGAIENTVYKAKLNFVAPKGTEDQGTVLFKIKAALKLNDSTYVRAGYSANASLILDKKDSILAIKESLIQYDRETDEPFVEIETAPQIFERRDIKLGISDGIKAEVIEGISMEDQIKVWNKASDEDKEKK